MMDDGQYSLFPDTLAEARAEVFRVLDDGSVCPACDRLAQARTRALNAGMATDLITVYRAAGTEFVYIPPLFKYGAEFTRLRHWGLIEASPEKLPDGNKAGVWRVTEQGADFILRGLRVPRKVRIYDNQVLDVSVELTSIKDALGSPFRFDELMADRL